MKKNTSLVTYTVVIVIWLIIWQLASAVIGSSLFLPAPIVAFSALFKLCKTAYYWECIFRSVTHILVGYILSVIAATLLSYITFIFPIVKTFFSLPLKIVRAVPVASFIILTLLWFSSSVLSTVIAFLMALPILYFSICEGLNSSDSKLVDMANVYKVSKIKKLIYIHIPASIPVAVPALMNALGLSWKAGIAAEVIGISRRTIGNSLNQSKIYLVTDELFAWTITIVILSFVFEGILKTIIKRILKRTESEAK